MLFDLYRVLVCLGRSVEMIGCMYVVPRYGRSQIWAYVVDLERFVVVPIEPRKGDAVEFFP